MVSTKIRMAQTAQMGPSTVQIPRGGGEGVTAERSMFVFAFMTDFLGRPATGYDRLRSAMARLS